MLVDKLRGEPKTEGRKLIDEAVKELDDRHERWRRYQRKCQNESYLERRDLPKTSVPPYSCNYLRSTIEVILGYMMDYPPSRTVVAVEGGDRLTAQLLQKAFDLEMAPYESVPWDALENALMFDAGFLTTGYDAESGRIVLRSVSPFSILPDPSAASWEECQYVVHRMYGISPDWIRHRYGVRVEEAESSASSGFSVLERDPRSDKGVKRRGVDVDRIWVYDYSSSAWLCMVICGNHVLEELTPNPYDHGALPIIPLYDMPPRYGIWGMGECECIEPLQDLADALDRQIYRVIRKTANRVRLIGVGAGITAQQFDDEPRSYDVVDPGRIVWDKSPTFPAELVAYRNMVEHYIQVVTGIFDVTAGQTPQRVTAASAIAVLQDAGLRRINKKQRYFEAALREAYRQLLYNMLQFYSVETWQRMLGDGTRIVGDYPEGVVLSEDRQQFKQRLGVVLVLSEVDPRYDVLVTTDSALPASRAQRARMALELASLGRIDTESLLEFLDWPDRSKVLQRLAMEKQQGATPMSKEPYQNMLNNFNPLEMMGMRSPAEAG